jgi:hypothetical protein
MFGVAAIGLGGAAPDVLETFFPRHRPHRPALAFDDGETHALDGHIVGKIAVAMKVTDGVVDGALWSFLH